MNNEQKCEVIKSLALGMEATEVAKLEGLSVYEVENILNECQTEISERKRFFEERSGGK